MPVESPFPPPFPQVLGVWGGGEVGKWGGGGGGRVDVQARVSVCECVCLLYRSIFFFFL